MSSSMRTDLLKWDEVADEPYLTLPAFPDLRLTPWRAGDEDEAMNLFNDPTIGKYAKRRPYPYLRKDLAFFSDVIAPAAKKTIDTILRPLLAAIQEPPATPKVIGEQIPFFPFIIIRHQPTGKLIGDVQIFQPTSNLQTGDFDAAFGGSVRQTDPPAEQVWEIAYNMRPEWRGKGVGGQMLDVIIEGWVKWVGLGGLMAEIETSNPASAGLVKSRGFTKRKTFKQAWPEDKGGGEREVAEWVVSVGEYKSRLGW